MRAPTPQVRTSFFLFARGDNLAEAAREETHEFPPLFSEIRLCLCVYVFYLLSASFLNDFVLFSPFPFCIIFTPHFTVSFHLPPSVCPFCKYPLPLLPVEMTPVFLLTAVCASVFLFPALLTLQSFLIAKVLPPHSHLACPSRRSRCEPRAARSPPRTPTSRAAVRWSQAPAPGAPSSTVTPSTWAAPTGLRDAPPGGATTPRWVLDVLGSTVTRRRVSTGSGARESWCPTEGVPESA